MGDEVRHQLLEFLQTKIDSAFAQLVSCSTAGLKGKDLQNELNRFICGHQLLRYVGHHQDKDEASLNNIIIQLVTVYSGCYDAVNDGRCICLL